MEFPEELIEQGRLTALEIPPCDKEESDLELKHENFSGPALNLLNLHEELKMRRQRRPKNTPTNQLPVHSQGRQFTYPHSIRSSPSSNKSVFRRLLPHKTGCPAKRRKVSTLQNRHVKTPRYTSQPSENRNAWIWERPSQNVISLNSFDEKP